MLYSSLHSSGACWGYGDPHYFDFNGVEFDHQGLCTYVLAQDKSNPPLFTVLLHNVECESFPGTTCPREVEVLYDGHMIRMLAEKNDFGVGFFSSSSCLPFHHAFPFCCCFEALLVIHICLTVGVHIEHTNAINAYLQENV